MQGGGDGILSEDDRVELIEGEVLEMEPVGSRHAACVDRLASLRHDRDRKVPLYAAAGVPEAWLVNLGGRAVTVFRGPSADGYRETRTLRAGVTLSPTEVPRLEVEVGEVLV